MKKCCRDYKILLLDYTAIKDVGNEQICPICKEKVFLDIATCITPKEEREEMTLIPMTWAGKFFGYTLSEIHQFIDFGKSKDFEPKKSLIG